MDKKIKDPHDYLMKNAHYPQVHLNKLYGVVMLRRKLFVSQIPAYGLFGTKE